MRQFEENRVIGSGGSWAILIVACLAIVAWGLANYCWIQDRPRAWDFGARPDTPGASIYSTSQPAPTLSPQPQFAPLPERATQPITQGGTMKRSTLIGLLVFCVGVGVMSYYLFSGPRMLVTPHIRAYQAEMPLTPPGVVPLNPRPPLPTTRQATTMPNPLFVRRRPTAADYAAGRTYYEYYGCLACHGPAGDGNGQVGESYVPAPADLRAAKFRAYSDGQLLRASLTGIGHEPVLEYTVLPEHRWHLELYVRSFSSPP